MLKRPGRPYRSNLEGYVERRELVKKLMALAAIPAVAKVFPQGQALAQALEDPRVDKAGT